MVFSLSYFFLLFTPSSSSLNKHLSPFLSFFSYLLKFLLDKSAGTIGMALSEEKRKIVLNLRRQGRSNSEIAEAVGISTRTVRRLVQLMRTKGTTKILKHPGRPRSLSPREERILIRMVLSQPARDSILLAKDLSQQLGREITPRIVRLALYRNGFRGRKQVKKPRLTARHRQQRLAFAREYAKKPASFWKDVVFSDEAPFRIFPTPSGQWTWRRPGEALEERNLLPTVKHGGGSIQVWGCLTWKGVGWMCRLPQGLDAETYLTILNEELEHTIRHYFRKGASVIFQQDGASVHTARCVQDHLKEKKIRYLPWPPQSPDLSPIENLWADVKHRLAQRKGDITSKDSLWEAIEEEWEATPKETCERLFLSMPSRLQAVIKAKGGATKY